MSIQNFDGKKIIIIVLFRDMNVPFNADRRMYVHTYEQVCYLVWINYKMVVASIAGK